MNVSKRFLLIPGLCSGFLFLHVPPAFASEMAVATVAETSDNAGVYNYNIALDDTGTTSIGTFWFSWVPGAGFLSVAPSAYGSPAGWTEKTTNAGAGIQWTAATDLLSAGDTCKCVLRLFRCAVFRCRIHLDRSRDHNPGAFQLDPAGHRSAGSHRGCATETHRPVEEDGTRVRRGGSVTAAPVANRRMTSSFREA
jgi:hypothetical protein